LIDQFLQDGTNRRDDDYGGAIENRTRFLFQVVDAVTSVWGPGRVGVRLSPFGVFNDISDRDPAALFTHAIRGLDKRGVAYLHLIEPRASKASETEESLSNTPNAATSFRSLFKNTLITAGGHTPETAAAVVASGQADAVAFGRLFISNPDLPERVRQGAQLNPYDRSTFYGGDAKGYIDYPALSAPASQVEILTTVG
jgi:N-ethylmaleimide reductase